MNPDGLLKHFDEISEAPDAVPRLRRFILDLAVRGKLVPQDPDDEPASKLPKRFEKDKTPFEIPEKWVSAIAGKLLNIQYGKALPAKDRSDQGRTAIFGSNGIVGYCHAALTEEPAIIIGRKGSAGALNLCDGPSWTTDVAYFLIPPAFFNIRFLFIALKTLDLGSLGKGVKPGLNRAEVYQLPLVVPPIAEQRRIVAKVDELMRVCDELEAAQAKRERRRDRLVAASLHGLNNGASEDDLHQNVGFYLNHIPRLTTRLEHIHQLRQTILNLAVSGKLVPQDPNDKPASEVLKAIEGEASRLFKSGKVRTQKSFQPVKDAEGLFALPGSWKWIRLLSLGITRTGNTPSKNNPEYFGNYIPFVKPADLKATGINYYGEGISREGLPYARLIPDGSVLMVCIGSSIGKVNRTERDICCNQQINAITPFIAACGGFLSLALKADFFRKLVLDHAGTGTLPIISKGKWEKLPVPLPPLAEQHRIVGKVKELMALCDELEARTNNTTTARRQLLEATLHEALFGRRELSQRALHAG